MELLKDIYESFVERLRSPILGSIFISFVGFNWKPIWYLLFAEKPVRARFLFFDANSDVFSLSVLPFLTGLAVAFIVPRLRYLGAWMAAGPMDGIASMQGDRAHRRKLKRLKQAQELEKERKRLTSAVADNAIEEAQAIEEAKLAGGDDVAERVKLELENVRLGKEALNKKHDEPIKLTKMQTIAIRFLGEAEKEAGSEEFDIVSQAVNEMYQDEVGQPSGYRRKIDLKTASTELLKLGIAEQDGFGKFFLTSKGFREFDRLFSDKK